MAKQRETEYIVTPFCNYAKHKGWHIENIHGNVYQSGLPDKYFMHKQFGPRWVEFKVINKDGSIHMQDSQITKFPIMLSYNVPIYVIAGCDFRGNVGSINHNSMLKSYAKLFQRPNAIYYIDPKTRRMVI